MITNVFSFLNSYHQQAHLGRFDNEGHRQVHALFHPEAGEVPEEGYIQLYNRLVPVRARAELTLPNQVYQNNLRTLCMNAQRFQEALANVGQELLASKQQQLAEAEQHLAQAERDSATPVRIGTYMCGRHTAPAYELEVRPHLVGSWNYANVESARAELREMEERVTRYKSAEAVQQVGDLTERSIIDGSFLLIEDLITTIDTDSFLPDLNKLAALHTIRSALSIPFLIENNLGNAEKVHEGIAAFLELEKIICPALSKIGPLRVAKDSYSFEIGEYLRTLLKEQPNNKELILFVISLNVFEEGTNAKHYILSAIAYHIEEGNFAAARALQELQLVTDETLANKLKTRMRVLLSNHDRNYTQENITNMRHIIAFNNGQCPLDQEALGDALVSASSKRDTLPLVEFIHSLMGEIPADVMKRALREAKHASEYSRSPILDYLKQHDSSSCVVS